MTTNLTPSNNTVAVHVSGCSKSTTVARSGVIPVYLNNAAGSWSAGGQQLPQNSFNLSSLAPTKLQAYLCGDVNTEARGMWMVVAADSSATSDALLAMLPDPNTVAISMMGRGDHLMVAMPSGDSPGFTSVVAGRQTSFFGSTSTTAFRASGHINGTSITSATMSGNTWTKPTWDGSLPAHETSRTITPSAALHGAAMANCLVLGSGLYRTRQASSTAFTTWVSPEIDVPTGADILAAGSYGWQSLGFFLIYKATAPVDIKEAVLMISPRWISAPGLLRQTDVTFTHVAGGVQLVANVQPLTISMAPGTSPLVVSGAPGVEPLSVTVTNPVNATVTNAALPVTLSATTVMPVCGAPWPHPRVAVTGVRVSALGVEVDRPLTVTNRPNCREVVLAHEYEVGQNAAAPMVVTSDIPSTPGPNGFVAGDQTAQPVRITGDANGTFKVEPADAAGLLVAQASGTPFKIESADVAGLKVAQAAGSVFDIRAGSEQLQPLWISDTDPDV